MNHDFHGFDTPSTTQPKSEESPKIPRMVRGRKRSQGNRETQSLERLSCERLRGVLERLRQGPSLSVVLMWLGALIVGLGLLMTYRHARRDAAATALMLTTSTPTATPTPLPTATEAPPQSPTPNSTPQPSPFLPTASATPTPLPTLTPLPTSTPTPTPVRPPAHSPPTRIVIPKIGVDAEVVEVGWKLVNQTGEMVSVWETADNAAGFHKTSAYPGNPGNTVLSGHHNIKGEVFRYLVDLEPGDEVILYAEGREYRYTVEDNFILQEKGVSAEQRHLNAQWIAPTEDERLTLVTCWPYWTNTHRVIVVAKPVESIQSSVPSSQTGEARRQSLPSDY
jgi:sortase A